MIFDINVIIGGVSTRDERVPKQCAAVIETLWLVLGSCRNITGTMIPVNLIVVVLSFIVCVVCTTITRYQASISNDI